MRAGTHRRWLRLGSHWIVLLSFGAGCGTGSAAPCVAPERLVGGACLELPLVHVFLPFSAGTPAPISQGSGTGYTHQDRERFAIDFAVPEGTAVVAAKEGRVLDTKDDADTACLEPECTAFANYVILDHADGTTARYLHLQQHGVRVAVGDWICRGDQVAVSGNTGRSTGPHLHFEVDDAALQSLPLDFAELGDVSVPLPLPWPVVSSANVSTAPCSAP